MEWSAPAFWWTGSPPVRAHAAGPAPLPQARLRPGWNPASAARRSRRVQSRVIQQAANPSPSVVASVAVPSPSWCGFPCPGPSASGQAASNRLAAAPFRRPRQANASSHSDGTPEAPWIAPASWPAMAAVVSASSPRFAASSTAERKSVVRDTAQTAACSDRTTQPDPSTASRCSPRQPPSMCCAAGLARTSGRGAPAMASASRSANTAEAVSVAGEPWVVRVCKAAAACSASRSRQYRMATGAKRISAPLPDASGSTEPASPSPVRRNRSRAARVALPMSKQVPVQE